MNRRPRLIAAALSAALAASLLGVVGVAAGSSGATARPAAAASGANVRAPSGTNARAAACPNDRTPASRSNLRAVRAAVVCLFNAERKRFALPPLHDSAQLDDAAQGHSDDMVKHDYFSHNSTSGSTPAKRITQAGYPWSAYGENIAAGYPTAVSVVTGWMSDVGHCANILYPGFADIGIGAGPKALPHFASGPAVWTVDFGLRSGTPPPSTDMQPSKTCPHGL